MLSDCFSSSVESLTAIIILRAKDWAERRPKNNTLTCIGIQAVCVFYACTRYMSTSPYLSNLSTSGLSFLR